MGWTALCHSVHKLRSVGLSVDAQDLADESLRGIGLLDFVLARSGSTAKEFASAVLRTQSLDTATSPCGGSGGGAAGDPPQPEWGVGGRQRGHCGRDRRTQRSFRQDGDAHGRFEMAGGCLLIRGVECG